MYLSMYVCLFVCMYVLWMTSLDSVHSGATMWMTATDFIHFRNLCTYLLLNQCITSIIHKTVSQYMSSCASGGPIQM